METLVDFYILDQAKTLRSLMFACKLVEQAYADQQQVYIHVANQEEAQRLDHLLWTYRDESFIPHQIYTPGEMNSAAVQIGFIEPDSSAHQTLMNLHPSFPGFYQQFNRIIEFVFAEVETQQQARERYRQYRALGCKIRNHKIQASEL